MSARTGRYPHMNERHFTQRFRTTNTFDIVQIIPRDIKGLLHCSGWSRNQYSIFKVECPMSLLFLLAPYPHIEAPKVY